MIMPNTRKIGEIAANDAWSYEEFALKKTRVNLIERLNHITGSPSAAMKTLQEEFIRDRMERTEKTAFVEICRALIAVTQHDHEFPI
jgi:hypothetical protein